MLLPIFLDLKLWFNTFSVKSEITVLFNNLKCYFRSNHRIQWQADKTVHMHIHTSYYNIFTWSIVMAHHMILRTWHLKDIITFQKCTLSSIESVSYINLTMLVIPTPKDGLTCLWDFIMALIMITS